MEALILDEDEFSNYIDMNWNKAEYYILMNNNKIVYQDYCCSAICETWWNGGQDATHCIVINEK